MKIHNQSILEQTPSCILLDLDNTLYPYAPAHEAGMASAREFAVRRLNISEGDFDAYFSDARTGIKRRLGNVASSHHRLLYFQRTVELAGLATQSFIALQLEQAYWNAYLGASELFPEVLDFLDDVRIAGIPTVIVTDLTAQIQHRKMLYFGLDRYVDWIVTSEEAGQDKPDAAIFHLALAKLGGVEGRVWMIGDNHERDIVGASNALNCFTLQKTHAGIEEDHSSQVQPDAKFASFSDLRKLLHRLGMAEP